MASFTAATPTKMPGRNSGDEESLPLYEQLKENATSADGMPDEKASPDEVRDFITNLLVTKRSLSLDYARCTATKWTAGSGVELRTYTPSMYLDIFGREDGWIIYREVRLVIIAKEKADKKKYGPWPYIGLAILLLIDTVFLWVAISDLSEGYRTAASFLAFFATLGFLFGSVVVSVTDEKPEKIVEKELREATTPHGNL